MPRSFSEVTKGIEKYVQTNHPDYEIENVSVGGVKGGKGHRAMIIIKHKHSQ